MSDEEKKEAREPRIYEGSAINEVIDSITLSEILN